MKKGDLTREQAIELVGLAAVEAVEKENCDFTNRLIDPVFDIVEFSACVACTHADGDDCILTAYYYQTNEDIDESGGELGNLDWGIEGYEVY